MSQNLEKPLVAAAFGRRPSRYPVWFMRQAGRYLPEYRDVRSKVDFVELCKTPALAAEVTLQPLRRYDLDASIIFSDILVPAMEMGQDLSFDKGHGPRLASPVRASQDLAALKKPHAEKDLGYVGEAISKTKAGLKPHQAMIGFAGAPFTVASYMIEGSGTKTFTEVKRLAFCDRPVFDGLMDLLAEVTVDYLKMQVAAGADALMLFDSWAGDLSPHDYVDLVLPATRKVAKEIRTTGVPVIYFPGQGGDRMRDLNGLDVDVISVHWRTRLSHAAAMLQESGLKVSLQGNLDPQLLLGSEEMVRTRTRLILEEAQRSARSHIFNLGHGLMPHTPAESLSWVINEIREFSGTT